MTFANPEYLVETEWLAAHLGEPDLRILDCTIDRTTGPDGVVRLASGRDIYDQGHIPTSVFADFVGDLTDRDNPLPSMLPPAEQFAEAMSRYGVGEGTRVVLYDGSRESWPHMWSAQGLVDAQGVRVRQRGGPERRLAQVEAGGPPGLDRAVCRTRRPPSPRGTAPS